MVETLAAEGRGGDTEVAHVTPGEMVIPRVFQTPEVLAALAKVAAAHGLRLDRFRVGDAHNSVNPKTGAPEFDMSDRDLDSIGRALAISNGSMLSGDPWSSMSSNMDRWASMPISYGEGAGGPSGLGSNAGGGAPYRYDGSEMEGITVTASPLPTPRDLSMGTSPWPLEPGFDRGLNAPGFGSFVGPNQQVHRLPPQAFWPGMLSQKRINSPFGKMRPSGPHGGLDIANPLGEPAYAAFDGKVDHIGTDSSGNNFIGWRDNYGNYHKYYHTSPSSGVVQGSSFKAGDVMGYSDG